MPRYPTRPPAAPVDVPGGVTAVNRALSLLFHLQEAEQGLALSELSERAQLVPSTTLRLLASLMHFDLVHRRGDGRYVVGAATVRLHSAYSAASSLHSIVPPALEQLAALTAESASFHVRQGRQRMVLYRVNSPQALTDQSRVGDTLPLARGSGGHVLQAFEGGKGQVYDRIRRCGYMAAPVSDRAPELAGISAAVFDAMDSVVGTVTLTMPAQRYDARHVAAVCATARQLSERLGCRGWPPQAGTSPAGAGTAGAARASRGRKPATGAGQR